MVFRSNRHSALSERDILVLFQLHEKVTLNIKQIHKLCFIDVKIFSAYKVLARLKKSGLVKSQSYELGKTGRLADVYLLTKAGFRVLSNNVTDLLKSTDTFREKQAPQLLSAAQHRMLIVEYWMSLELGLRNCSNHSLKLFVPEYKKLPNGRPITLRVIQPNGEPLQVRNDALFILTNEQKRKQFLFALEIDRATMPIQTSDPANSIMHNKLAARSSINDKYAKILSAFACGNQAFVNLGGELANFSGMRVVLITHGSQHVLNIADIVSRQNLKNFDFVFLFTHWGESISSNAWDSRYLTLQSNGRKNTIRLHQLLC